MAEQFYTMLVFPLLLLVGQALVAIGQRRLNQRMDEGERMRNDARAETQAKRDAEAEWRNRIDIRLDDIEERQTRAISAQAAQIRSDIVHKCHRYLDDLGKASTEEKESLHDEQEQYCQFCNDLDLENNFIDNLVERVMALPER